MSDLPDLRPASFGPPKGPYMEVRYGRCHCHGDLCVWPKEFGGYKAIKNPELCRCLTNGDSRCRRMAARQDHHRLSLPGTQTH